MNRSSSDIYAIAPISPVQPTHTSTQHPAVAASSSSAAGRNFHPRRMRSYGMGQTDLFNQDFFSGSLTADQAIFNGMRAARNRARWLERNHNLTRKFLIMIKTNVIGAKGMRLQSLASDIIAGNLVESTLDRQQIEAAYAAFSKARNFSADTRMDRRLFAQVGFQRVIVDGECIVHKMRGADNPHRYTNQLIDSELLDHELNRPALEGRNEIRMGVEIDKLGRPAAYHFLEEAPVNWYGTAAYSSRHKRVPADEIEHIFIPDRPGQTRGFTYMMATGERAKMIDNIERAVAIGYRVAASKMGFFKRGDGYEPAIDPKTGKEVGAFPDVPQDAAPGEFWELPEGLDFEAFDPGYPGATYDEYTKSITRSMAAGLGVSYPEFGNDFSNVSYSAGQIGVHSDIAMWSDFQQFWIDHFEEPVFLEWLPMAITAGVLTLPMSKLAKFQRIKFQPPRRRHIDPMKTHKAQSIALGDMSRSPFDVCAENGVDFEDVVEDFARAKTLLEKHNLPVPSGWGSHVELSAADAGMTNA